MAAAKKKTVRPIGRARAGTGADRERNRLVASNRRARHDYEILDTLECGIVLQGSEVKSLREGRIALQDSYARIDDGELWLFGVHVPPYAQANGFGAHDPDRRRKLLVHRRQIDEWMGKSKQSSLTMVPLSHLLQGRPGQGRAGARPGAAPVRQAPRHRRPGRRARRRPRGPLGGQAPHLSRPTAGPGADPAPGGTLVVRSHTSWGRWSNPRG